MGKKLGRPQSGRIGFHPHKFVAFRLDANGYGNAARRACPELLDEMQPRARLLDEDAAWAHIRAQGRSAFASGEETPTAHARRRGDSSSLDHQPSGAHGPIFVSPWCSRRPSSGRPVRRDHGSGESYHLIQSRLMRFLRAGRPLQVLGREGKRAHLALDLLEECKGFAFRMESLAFLAAMDDARSDRYLLIIFGNRGQIEMPPAPPSTACPQGRPRAGAASPE